MDIEFYKHLQSELKATETKLIAVSKTRSVEEIQAAYDLGIRDFGENKVQEMTEKYALLPKDIHWHLIGHLQSNKVKYIAPFVSLIHGVDSFKLLKEIDAQGQKNNRIIPCLLQCYIAQEETKFGFEEDSLYTMLQDPSFKDLKHIEIVGLMGMASNTTNETQVTQEFETLQQLFVALKKDFFASQDSFHELSMGMSGDYRLAIKAGSTMVRIGSSLFGARI